MLILEPIVRKILLIVIINYSLTKTTINNIMDCPALIYHMLIALIIAVQISLLAVVHKV